MARPCCTLHDPQPPGACHWCDLDRAGGDYHREWAKTPCGQVPPSTRPVLCLHLGPVVPVASIREHYHCERGHGTICPCRHCGPACRDYEPDG